MANPPATHNALRISILLSLTSGILSCYFHVKEDPCTDFDSYLVSRDAWGAEKASGPLECLREPAKYVIIHHTVTKPCNDDKSCSAAVKMIQKEHLEDKKWPDIGYHFVICGNGKAYVGRPGYKMGGHTKDHNRVSIGIAFLGDFTKATPSTEMLDLVPKIVYCGVRQGYIHPNFQVIGHRDAYCSPCPGTALYKVVKSWPRFPNAVPIPSFTCDAKTTTETATTATETTTEVMTTTAAASTTEDSPPTSAMPIYYYIVMSRKPIPPDVLNKLVT